MQESGVPVQSQLTIQWSYSCSIRCDMSVMGAENHELQKQAEGLIPIEPFGI